MTIRSETPNSSPTIDGVWNFRDVGGAGSAVDIRADMLFRSSELSGLTPAGAQTLRELGVTDLYDLRSAAEIARTGADRVDDGIRVHQVPFALAVPGQERAPHEVAYREMMLDSVAAGRAPDRELQAEFMRAEYRRFAELPGTLVALKAVVAQLVSGATALVHCAAGKDRTGFLVAVLLDAVGIAYEEILNDYLLSNAAIATMRSRILAHMREAEPQLPEGAAAVLTNELLGVREDYLNAGFDQLANTFGSSVAMLRKAGVDAAGVDALRGVLT